MFIYVDKNPICYKKMWLSRQENYIYVNILVCFIQERCVCVFLGIILNRPSL